MKIPAFCAFCDIIEWEAGRFPATRSTAAAEIVQRWSETVAFVPLKPVTDGHVLIVPRAHVADALSEPLVTATTFARAAEFADAAGIDCNLITSVGEDATQSIWHLHVHVVPRRPGDGLLLPWSAR